MPKQTRGMDEIDEAASREGHAFIRRMVSIGDPRQFKRRPRGIRCGERRHNPTLDQTPRPTLEQILGFGDPKDRFQQRRREKVPTIIIHPPQPKVIVLCPPSR